MVVIARLREKPFIIIDEMTGEMLGRPDAILPERV